MAIQEGQAVPSTGLAELVDGKPTPVSSDELLGGKRVVLFSVPGAFTPTCSAKHLPGFIEQVTAIKAKGIDEVICTAVNDVFVMGAWGEAQQAAGKVRMLADGNGDLASALGLTMDGTGFGMGRRGQRFAMVVNDGKVEKLFVEPGPGLTVSSAESVLESL
ncbi:MAG: peroxiredoxin [bacterium]